MTTSANCEVVSTIGSAIERKPAPASFTAWRMFSRSRVLRARRSVAVTISTSPASSAPIARLSWGRSAVAALLPFPEGAIGGAQVALHRAQTDAQFDRDLLLRHAIDTMSPERRGCARSEPVEKAENLRGFLRRCHATFRRRFERDTVLARVDVGPVAVALFRSEEHTSELQSLMRISYAVFCLKKK